MYLSSVSVSILTGASTILEISSKFVLPNTKKSNEIDRFMKKFLIISATAAEGAEA
jgi:hypothetical protein